MLLSLILILGNSDLYPSEEIFTGIKHTLGSTEKWNLVVKQKLLSGLKSIYTKGFFNPFSVSFAAFFSY